MQLVEFAAVPIPTNPLLVLIVAHEDIYYYFYST